MHQPYLRYLTGLLFIVLFASCFNREEVATKDEAFKLAESIQESFKRKSARKFNEALDGESLATRIGKASKTKLGSATLKGAVEGLKGGQLGTQLVDAIGKSGSYEFVKQYEKDKKQRLVFRLFGNDGSLNYHDMEVVKVGTEAKIADIYIYLSGENLSTTLAESLSLVMDKFSDMSLKDKQHLEDIRSIRGLISEGKFEEANKLFQRIPADLRNEKTFRLLYIQIASGLGDEVHLKAIDDFSKAYPDAANMYLMKVDAYIIRKDFKAAMKAVNQLDSLIDKDEFLDFYRGVVSKQLGDTAAHRNYFEKLVKNKPYFSLGLLELGTTYLDNKETDKAIPYIKRYRNSSGVDQEQMDALFLLYPELVGKVDKL